MMTNVDISSLGNLQPAEDLNLDDYADAQSFQLPKAGRYVVQAPSQFPTTAFGATKAGYLSAQIDPTIVGPTGQGLTIRFAKVSAKVYDRRGTKVSQVGDYLRANGITGTIPSSPQAQADAIAATAGRTYEVELDWEARHGATQFSVKGMRNFPKLANGEYQTWVQHPTETGVDGEPLRLRANLVIRNFIPAS